MYVFADGAGKTDKGDEKKDTEDGEEEEEEDDEEEGEEEGDEVESQEEGEKKEGEVSTTLCLPFPFPHTSKHFFAVFVG